MVVWFYRAKQLRAAQDAAERHPSLTLRTEHPSLVLFRREYRNESEPSVLLFDRYDDFKAIVLEMNKADSYGAVAVDTFGDEWDRTELREMMERSVYAIKEPGGMGTDHYRVNGKVEESIAAILEQGPEALAAEAAKHISEALGDLDLRMAARIVKFGIASKHAFSGVTRDDLLVGGSFDELEADDIIARAQAAGLL